MDETGFIINPRLEKVIAKKGARQVHKVAHGNSHDHISVVPTISAAGTYIPPLIIYKGSRTIPDLLEGAPAGTVMGFTESGYMRESLFQMYIEHFNRSIPPARPVILMLDGHKSHINYTSINFCHSNGILLYALPPNTTHILQPCELPFAKLKKEYDKSCERLRVNTGGEFVTKYTFAKVLNPAFIETYTPTAICNAFKVTGIWPLNPNAIEPDRLNPSLLTEQFDNYPQIENMPQVEPTPTLTKPKNSFSTRASTIEQLELLTMENESQKLEIASLKRKLEVIQEELEVLKTPGTCDLRLALRYPLPRKQAIECTESNHVDQSEPQQSKKKTKDYTILSTPNE